MSTHAASRARVYNTTTTDYLGYINTEYFNIVRRSSRSRSSSCGSSSTGTTSRSRSPINSMNLGMARRTRSHLRSSMRSAYTNSAIRSWLSWRTNCSSGVWSSRNNCSLSNSGRLRRARRYSRSCSPKRINIPSRDLSPGSNSAANSMSLSFARSSERAMSSSEHSRAFSPKRVRSYSRSISPINSMSPRGARSSRSQSRSWIGSLSPNNFSRSSSWSSISNCSYPLSTSSHSRSCSPTAPSRELNPMNTRRISRSRSPLNSSRSRSPRGDISPSSAFRRWMPWNTNSCSRSCSPRSTRITSRDFNLRRTRNHSRSRSLNNYMNRGTGRRFESGGHSRSYVPSRSFRISKKIRTPRRAKSQGSTTTF